MSNVLDTLKSLRGGLVLKQTERDMAKLIEAIRDSGKKGSISIQLTLEPHGEDNKEIHVSAKVTSKAPPAPGIGDRSIFFAVRDQLVRDDPDQKKLPLAATDSQEYQGRADGSSPSESRYQSRGNA